MAVGAVLALALVACGPPGGDPAESHNGTPPDTAGPVASVAEPAVTGEGLIGDEGAVRWLSGYAGTDWYQHLRHVYWMGEELWIDTNLLPGPDDRGKIVATCEALARYQASLGRPDGTVRVNGQDGEPVAERAKARGTTCAA